MALFITVMEAERTSETFIYFNETTWYYVPEGCHLHSCHDHNLKSRMERKDKKTQQSEETDETMEGRGLTAIIDSYELGTALLSYLYPLYIFISSGILI
jgi:hypothetical protein